MYKSYVEMAWRNLLRDKGYSLINIGGLCLGMTVAMLIGLWVHDELSFNKSHENYEKIAIFWGGGINPDSKEIEGMVFVEYPVGDVLRNNYPHYFKHVSKAFRTGECTLSNGSDFFKARGLFVEEDFLSIFSLKLNNGSQKEFYDPNAVFISASAAKSIFREEDPINKIIRLENFLDLSVKGVYEDVPDNSSLREFDLFLPWSLLPTYKPGINDFENNWTRQFVNVYVQLQSNTTIEEANSAIYDLYSQNIPKDYYAAIEQNKPFSQLIPMEFWHLYSEFKNGKPAGGRITYVWLFGIVGFLILLVACFNFINLSTARSEKRAKEVGIRKTMGSNRVQLIIQFLSESFIAVLISFIGALFLLVLTIDFFNELADKSIIIPFKNQAFWIISILFILLTGLLAGLYPAIYLSSFKPVTVLKGSVRTGRFAALPRKVLVIAQFSVAVILVLGTIMIHKQIEFAKNRPVGYDLQSLISLDLSNPRFKEKVNVIKAELIQSGTIIDVATSSSRLTGINAFGGGFDWQGKDPSRNMEVIFSNISPEFGKTLGWKLISGRDFSEDLTSDEHDVIIINQAAAKQMGLENPIGTELIHNDEYGNPIWSKTIIGVVQDIVVESPYQSVKPTIYYFNEKASNVLHFKLKPELSYHEALSIIETTLQKIVPLTVYDFIFVDEEFSKKFKQEVLLGKLSGVFAGMAVFISSLGLFGLSSFVAEQRKKEIGIRKVMGASATNIWSMLSREFILLVLYACIFAVPPGYILVNRWLQRFDYHIEISLQLIILTCLIAVLTTLLTVSYQSVKAAWMNPTRSLRNE